jgi:hypothetical protein
MEPFKFFSGYHNSISLNLNTVNVQGNVRPLRAQWTPEIAQDLSAYHGIDIASELTGLLSDQIAAEIDNEIIQNLSTFNTILPIAQRLAATTLANDIVSVQPLPAPSSELFYIDFKKSLRDFKFFRGW